VSVIISIAPETPVLQGYLQQREQLQYYPSDVSEIDTPQQKSKTAAVG
jgi:hypothetical protein